MTVAGGTVVSAGGVRLRVRDQGRGPAALVLHGFTGSGQSMQGVADAIGSERRVIRPDLVGHGESDAPADLGAYTMSSCVDQLLALLDALELERVDAIGYSMGGRTVLALAVTAPDRVRSLALMGATPGLATEKERAVRITADETLARRIVAEGVESFVDEWMALPLFASQRRLGRTALAAARAERLRCRAEGLSGSLRGMGTGAMPPMHGELQKLRVPVLLVVGEEDAKFRAIAAEMAAVIPDARVAILDEAGHAVHLEQPVAFGEVLRDFLDCSSGVVWPGR